MRASRSWLSALLVAGAVLAALGLPGSAAHAFTPPAEGTYTMDYVVLKAEDDSVSMANDYWEKPATVTFDHGKTTVRLTVNHSKWVTQFKVPGAGGFVNTKILRTDEEADTRTVSFEADDLSKPLESKIHVTVEDIDYDHDYTIRLSFKPDTMAPLESAGSGQTAKPETAAAAKPEPAQTSEPAGGAGTAEPAASGKESATGQAIPKPAAGKESSRTDPAPNVEAGGGDGQAANGAAAKKVGAGEAHATGAAGNGGAGDGSSANAAADGGESASAVAGSDASVGGSDAGGAQAGASNPGSSEAQAGASGSASSGAAEALPSDIAAPAGTDAAAALPAVGPEEEAGDGGSRFVSVGAVAGAVILALGGGLWWRYRIVRRRGG